MDLKKLVTALRTKCGLQVLESGLGERQIRILGRLPQERMGDWLLFIHHALVQLDDKKPGWTVDISKHYFLYQRKVVYGWRLIFQAPKIVEFLPSILNAVMGAPESARREIMEVPLLGVGPNRNSPTHGRGAGGVLTHLTGPAALAAIQRNQG
jgi:hypothetical protein